MKGTRGASLFAAGFFLLPLAGCGDSGAASAESKEAAFRDSAGIVIVENAAVVSGAARGWRLASEPTVRIGAFEGPPEQQLFRVLDARRLSDGRIAVANSGSHQIRFYGPDGHHLSSVGREGEGPGEFRGLIGLYGTVGDSLLAWDGRLQRASLFASDGSAAGAFRLAAPEERASPWLEGRFADGSLLVRVRSVRDAPAQGLVRDTVLLVRYADPETPTDTVARLPGAESFYQSFDRGFIVHQLPFGADLHFAVAGSKVVVGRSDSYELQVRCATGEIERLVRRAHEPRRVERRDLVAAVEERLAPIEDEERRREYRRAHGEMPIPSTMPAFAGVAASTDGHIWVRHFDPPGTETNAWDVFDPDGRLLAEVELPPGFRPTEIGADYVLGVRRDDLEVEYVELYAIERP